MKKRMLLLSVVVFIAPLNAMAVENGQENNRDSSHATGAPFCAAMQEYIAKQRIVDAKKSVTAPGTESAQSAI